MEITLSILIGTMNRLPTLKKTLEALSGKVRIPHEIIVVDAGSTDGTLEYLRGLKGITLVEDGQPIGQAKSLNKIIKNLNSRYMCWLSDDNVVVDGMLDVAVDILMDDMEIGMVSLKVKDVTGAMTDLPYIGGIWSGILNCNQGMLATNLMKEIGGFDENFRDYGIDIDLTTQVLMAGYKVVFTKDIAIHHYRDHETNTWINTEERRLRLQEAQIKYEIKYPFLKIEDDHLLRFYLAIRNRLLSVSMHLYKLAKRLSIDVEYTSSINERDWSNLFSSRFISINDFRLGKNEPYYLVQKIRDSDLAYFVNYHKPDLRARIYIKVNNVLHKIFNHKVTFFFLRLIKAFRRRTIEASIVYLKVVGHHLLMFVKKRIPSSSYEFLRSLVNRYRNK